MRPIGEAGMLNQVFTGIHEGSRIQCGDLLHWSQLDMTVRVERTGRLIPVLTRRVNEPAAITAAPAPVLARELFGDGGFVRQDGGG